MGRATVVEDADAPGRTEQSFLAERIMLGR